MTENEPMAEIPTPTETQSEPSAGLEPTQPAPRKWGKHVPARLISEELLVGLKREQANAVLGASDLFGLKPSQYARMKIVKGLIEDGFLPIKAAE